jgi:ribosomal protein L31E
MAKEIKETKKLEEFKESPENKAAVAADSGDLSGKSEEKSRPAVEKAGKKEKKTEGKVELEREYIVPLRRSFLNVPRYRRAKKAVRILKEFMVRHMNVRDGDLRKVRVDIHLNNEIWFKGIKNPLPKVKVNAKKIDGIVYVTLADPADYVKFKMAREEKAKAVAEDGKKKVKTVKKEKVEVDADKDGVEDAKEEKEDVKAGAESDAKFAKADVKAEKHTAQGKHAQKTAPVRKVLK